MVNFHDPAVIQRNLVALRSVYLVTCGVYIWEFLTTLGYEINIIRGRRPYRWTIYVSIGSIFIYSFSRITALVTVVLELVFTTTTTPSNINCHVWITFQVLFGYLSMSAASLLIVLRRVLIVTSSFAIWNRNKIAVAIAGSAWVTNFVTSSRGIALLRSDWDAAQQQCIVVNPDSSKLHIIVFVLTDIVLLLIVLVGLLRWRSDGGGTFGIARLLWKQGVMWLLLATVAEVPPVVFIILNLNEPLNLICQFPSVIAMTIAATRMYRSLADFASLTTEINSDRAVSKLQWNQTPLNRIHVTVDSTHEPNQVALKNHHDSHISTEEQPCDSDKPQGYRLRQWLEEPV